MAASKSIGGISVFISASTDKFVKGINLARRSLTSFARGVKNLVFSLKGLTAAFAAGMFVRWTANQFEAVAALGDLSDKLGITTEKLAGYQLAASEIDITNQILERSLTKLSNAGLTLPQWIENTSKLATQQQKLAAATEMFGIRGASMVRFLTGGTKALDEAERAAVSLGLALDRKTVMGVDRAGEAFARFKMAVSGIFRSLAAEIAPFVEVLSNKATSFLATNGRGKGIGASIANAIIEMTKFVADAIKSMVGGVLDTMADIRRGIFDFRFNAPQWLGVGYQSTAKALAADQAAAAARIRANNFKKGPAWSSMIEDAMAEARKQAAAQAALAPAAGGSLFGRAKGALGGLFGGANAQNAGQLGGKLWQGFAGLIQGLPGFINSMQFAGMQHFGRNFKTGQLGARPALAFAESGTADSFRQRADIRRQNETQKVEKDQLKALRELVQLAKQGGGGLPVVDL